MPMTAFEANTTGQAKIASVADQRADITDVRFQHRALCLACNRHFAVYTDGGTVRIELITSTGKAKGARWKVTEWAGSEPSFPDVCPNESCGHRSPNGWRISQQCHKLSARTPRASYSGSDRQGHATGLTYSEAQHEAFRRMRVAYPGLARAADAAAARWSAGHND
jgi:hypothetical protein